jgi:hypothetical protein
MRVTVRSLHRQGKERARFNATARVARSSDWRVVVGKAVPDDCFKQKEDASQMKDLNSLRRRSRDSSDELVLLHFSPERDRADLQRVGRLTPIAPKPRECAHDHGAFLGLQIETVF